MYYREETKSHSVALENDQIIMTAPSVFAEQPHSDVSDKYGFIPTINVIDGLRAEGWYPVDATQKNVRDKSKQDFTKHLVRFRRLNDDITVGDSVVELLLTNSHDRSSGFVLHAGVFRMACANGIVIADSTFNKVSVRHNRFATERVIEGSYNVIDEVPLITSQIEGMQAIELNRAEQEIFARTALGYILPEPKQNQKIITSSENLTSQMLRPKRSSDTGMDLWSTFNVVQEKALRGGIRMSKWTDGKGYRNSTTREVKNIDKNIKLNKALFEMAMQMKAIKEAAIVQYTLLIDTASRNRNRQLLTPIKANNREGK